MNLHIKATVILALATLTFFSTTTLQAVEHKEADLIAVLKSDAPKADKAITCKYLAVWGTKNAVPELAKLLEDEELISWARIALEAIPGDEAGAAVRDALGKLKGRSLIGVINSTAVRRDAKAVDQLAALMKDADPAVASAAAVALGTIGGSPATDTLAKALPGAAKPIRSAVGEGCVRCAEKLLAEGKADEAAKLYEAVRTAKDMPKQRVVEATRGVILAKKSAGIPLLAEQLASKDKIMFALGLQTAREIPGEEVTKALMAEFKKAAPKQQAILLMAIADRGDEGVLPAIVEAATSGPKQVRLMAIGSLGKAGNASTIDTLLKIVGDDDADLAEAAKATLAELPGDDVNANLVSRLEKTEAKALAAVIAAVGRRRIAAATPALIKAADSDDLAVRTAAMVALGETIKPDQLSVLLKKVADAKNDDETKAAAKGLKVAAVRMPDREACAAELAEAMADMPVAKQCIVLEILGAVAGKKALATIDSAAQGDNDALKDAASRMLGRWMTVEAAPVLLNLAKTENEKKYQIRALRGYIRLVRQFPLPQDQRDAMCKAAMEAANRDAEKKLVLQVMERYPSIKMLQMAAAAKETPALEADADKAALAIAQKLAGKGAKLEDLMAQIGAKPVKVEIIKAEYGAGKTFKDVTAVVKKAAGTSRLIMLPSATYNAAFGGDPVGGVVKQLKIQYKIDGKPGEATFAENAPVLLK